MAHPSEVNAAFEECGWTINLPLAELDQKYFSEDLAQFERYGTIVDFGFYGDGADPGRGIFRIYIVENQDWDSFKAKMDFAEEGLAFNVLRVLARLPSFGRPSQ